MDIAKLGQILKEQNLLVKETDKNFICICPYCGDHPDPSKRGHLYVSKRVEAPFYHCFINECAGLIPKLITDITGNVALSKEVLDKSEINLSGDYKKRIKRGQRTKKYELPEITFDSFQGKRIYIKKRTCNRENPEDIPGLIFNFAEFFEKNNIRPGKDFLLSSQEFDILQKSFVGFLGEHGVLLYCRNADENSSFKFKKIQLQEDPYDLLDYWRLPAQNKFSQTLVIAEGNFNILGERAFDTLGLRETAHSYVSCNSSSYSSVIKSFCFDQSIYQCDVVILSDTDKKAGWYYNTLQNDKHIIRSIKLYYNHGGKDFGTFPIKPYSAELNLHGRNKTKTNRAFGV